MGILSAHRNLVSNSNLRWFIIRRICNSSLGLSSSKLAHQSPPHAPKSNKHTTMLLIEHYHRGKSWSRFPPHNFSLISAEKSWTDHHNLCNPFSRYGDYCLTGSCNEFILLVYFNNMYDSVGAYGKYVLWNPTTNSIKLLPPPGPEISTMNKHGFGFDSESEDYKLIRFPCYMYVDDCEEEIDNHFKLYSLKTNSWKKIMCPCTSCGDLFSRPSVHVNGVCYWLASPSTTSLIIVSFDFASEKFFSAPHIPRPPKFDEGILGDFSYDFLLVEFDGSLAALVYSGVGFSEEEKEGTFSFEVWGWNGASWNERMPRTTIDVPSTVFNVMGLFEDDKLFLQVCHKGEVLLFDLAKRKMENLGIHADLLNVNIFPFNASSSINSLNSAI